MSAIERFGLVVCVLAFALLAGAIAPHASTSPSPSPMPSATSIALPPTSNPSRGASIFPDFNPTKAIYQAIGGLLYGMDSMFSDEMSQIWNPLLARGDNLDMSYNTG